VLDKSKSLATYSKKQFSKESFFSKLKCLACCCCTTTIGVRDLLVGENTREFATAVVIGESFYSMVQALTAEIIAPLIYSCPPFTISNWYFETGNLYIVLVEGDNRPKVGYGSAGAARADGALVVDIHGALDDVLTLIFTLLTLYWIFRLIDAFAKRPTKVEEAASEQSDPISPSTRGHCHSRFARPTLSSGSLDAQFRRVKATYLLLYLGADGLEVERIAGHGLPEAFQEKYSNLLITGLDARNMERQAGDSLQFTPALLEDLSTYGFVVVSQTERIMTLMRTPSSHAGRSSFV